MARAPFDASTPRRARGGSVPRGSLSPLCDASFVEAVASAPGLGADERREGHEGGHRDAALALDARDGRSDG